MMRLDGMLKAWPRLKGRGLGTWAELPAGVTPRGDYSRLGDGHVQAFERMLGPSGVFSDPSELQGYNTDWLGQTRGQSRVVLRPKSVEEVSGILKICSSQRLAVCPQGGNTGLVAGSVPVFDEVILSTSLMNKIINVDPLAGTVTCEAGCVLEAVNSRLEEDDLMMPYDLGSKGSCQIGGNISTCAGGLRLIRYGSLQANLLGVQAVLANGEVLDCLNAHRKDNTGYHLRQLFVGAEGTLGIVTKAVINCPIRPKSVSLTFLGLKDFDGVLGSLVAAKRCLGEILSSFEMMDRKCMEAVIGELGLKCPLGGEGTPSEFYLLVESHGSDQDHDRQKMNRLLEDLVNRGIAQDGTFTDSPSTMNEIWKLRERIIEALAKKGRVYTYDLTFERHKCYGIVEAVERHLARADDRIASAIRHGAVEVSCCGHIGDGNIHLNVTSEDADLELLDSIEPFVFEWTARNGGSISAEHGVGVAKKRYLHLAKTREALALMKILKINMDPYWILNPYKVLSF